MNLFPDPWVCGGVAHDPCPPSQSPIIEAAFHALSEGIVIHDDAGRVIACNPAAGLLLGMRVDELIGAGPGYGLQARMDDGTLLDRPSTPVLHVLETGEAVRHRLLRVVRPADRQPQWLRASFMPLPSRSHAGEGVVVTLAPAGEGDDELARIAFIDPLTGVANRRLLDEHLELALARAERASNRLALVDGLKGVNDTHGHAAGDELLRQIAARVRDEIRACDVVGRPAGSDPLLGRQGGDEFVLLLADLEHEPQVVFEAVRERIEGALAAPVSHDSIELRPSASFGLATYPDDGTSTEVLIAHADRMMYGMKRR